MANGSRRGFIDPSTRSGIYWACSWASFPARCHGNMYFLWISIPDTCCLAPIADEGVRTKVSLFAGRDNWASNQLLGRMRCIAVPFNAISDHRYSILLPKRACLLLHKSECVQTWHFYCIKKEAKNLFQSQNYTKLILLLINTHTPSKTKIQNLSSYTYVHKILK